VFDPTKPDMMHPGMMQTMTALGGQPVRPVNPLRGMSAEDRLGADMQGLRMDYRQDMGDYRSALHDYHRQYLDGLRGNRGMGQQQGPVQGLPTPVGAPAPAQPANIMAPGMVGQSYYTQGMKPGATPFDLPTY
jgi:hypothetical protein